MDCWQWMQWWGPQFHWFWLIPFAFMILMFVVLIVLFRRAEDWRGGGWPGGRASPRSDQETPRQVLDRRYASGEIAREQYDQMKRDIA